MKLIVSLFPHIHTKDSIPWRMWNVVIALIPALVMSIITFGWDALWVILISIGACLLTEWLITRFLFKEKKFTLLNGSALITGLLLGFNLPSILPWWMIIMGGVVAIGIAKMSFGGLGANIWNPALVGRVFLLLSFPAAMTTWPTGINSPFHQITTGASQAAADASSGATLLTYINNGNTDLSSYNLLDMAIGNMNGSLGEIGGFAIIGGFVWLLLTRVITWHIPVAVVGSAAFFSWVFGGAPILDIFAGGLLLGAVFMATDYVTSPMTHTGQIIYGIMIGFLTIIIRRFSAYPEGVSFAILLMNSFVPLINRYCRPSIFGMKERRKMAV
ncbi:MAG: RnfABCDGE type electron transport complex subunit D [Muribaculaceae bacterium]|nr:RnfABCDGE type electron transport complex subunit D [Muribaculaceae bacterium]